MTKTCGTCRYFKPGEARLHVSLRPGIKESYCMMLNKTRYAEEKPVRWCWREKEIKE